MPNLPYFDLFEIPPSLVVDSSSLIQKFYALSKKFHPDNFTLFSEEEQEQALIKTSEINAAKKMLDQPYSRLGYILRETGILQDEEKQSLPPEFLAEMMDLNEELMELQFEPDPEGSQRILERIQCLEEAILDPVKHYIHQPELPLEAPVLEALKEYYLKKKYLNRLRESLKSR